MEFSEHCILAILKFHLDTHKHQLPSNKVIKFHFKILMYIWIIWGIAKLRFNIFGVLSDFFISNKLLSNSDSSYL